MLVTVSFSNAADFNTAEDLLKIYALSKIEMSVDGYSICLRTEIDPMKEEALDSGFKAINAQIDEHSDTFALNFTN